MIRAAASALLTTVQRRLAKVLKVGILFPLRARVQRCVCCSACKARNRRQTSSVSIATNGGTFQRIATKSDRCVSRGLLHNWGMVHVRCFECKAGAHKANAGVAVASACVKAPLRSRISMAWSACSELLLLVAASVCGLRFCLVRGAAELGKPVSTDPYMEDLGAALDGLDAALVSPRARAK